MKILVANKSLFAFTLNANFTTAGRWLERQRLLQPESLVVDSSSIRRASFVFRCYADDDLVRDPDVWFLFDYAADGRNFATVARTTTGHRLVGTENETRIDATYVETASSLSLFRLEVRHVTRRDDGVYRCAYMRATGETVLDDASKEMRWQEEIIFFGEHS